MSDLRGAVVLVTGATGHVGSGFARAAKESGAEVVLLARSAAAKAQLESDVAGALVIEADTASEASLASLREKVTERFGRIDHVFAPMGGWWSKGASLAQPASELEALLDTYVTAQFRLLRSVAPALRGSYTIVTGAAGEGFAPGSGLLVAAVTAQYGISRVLRRESAEAAFRVNELRIYTRIEREPRRGVIVSRDAGEHFLDILRGDERGKIFRYDGRLSTMPG
jgi:NAD(P)-dependent dehydrogenase (short-subunit alcohol dehydrogenase family)